MIKSYDETKEEERFPQYTYIVEIKRTSIVYANISVQASTASEAFQIAKKIRQEVELDWVWDKEKIFYSENQIFSPNAPTFKTFTEICDIIIEGRPRIQ